jgi:hypothetical protein
VPPARPSALLITEPNKGITPLTWLKAIPAAVKPDHVRDILDRCVRSERSEFRQNSARLCILIVTGSSFAKGVRPLLT